MASSSSSSSSSEGAFRLRALEPDVFHSMVKMHLSFLLDLNVDDCDCSFLMDPTASSSSSTTTASASSKEDKESTSLARRIFTPKRHARGGGASSSSAAGSFAPSSSSCSSGVMDGAALTMEGVCQAYQLVEYLGREHNIVIEG